MPLIQDNSYLINFDNDEVIGYMINDKTYVNKNNVTIMKDIDLKKIFAVISSGQIAVMCFAYRGYETFYKRDVEAQLFEIVNIIEVKTSHLQNEHHEFSWVNRSHETALELSLKYKIKDTSKNK